MKSKDTHGVAAGGQGPTHEPSGDHGRSRHNTTGVDAARATLRVLLETAEYISDRTAHVSTNVSEGMKAGETLSAVARQIRTLSSNTSLEAARLGGSGTVGEIARQMRLLSQKVTALSEHLSVPLRSQSVTLGEMSGAIDALLVDAAATQAVLSRDSDVVTGAEPAGSPAYAAHERPITLETIVNG